jgi:hypothetical protein
VRRPIVAIFGVVVTIATGFGGPPSAAAAPAVEVAALIDARWMGFDTTAPWNWVDVERWITPDFQQFGFRPVGETESPHPCQGCGENPSTVDVKVYAPGRFDPATALKGRPVDVDGKVGYFRGYDDASRSAEPDGFRDALLAWQYAEGAWATVRGLTHTTAGLDRMLELASALRPDERAPVRVPLSLTTVPARMPLVGVHTSYLPVYQSDSDYGTTLHFGPCVTLTKAVECRDASDQTGSLSVKTWARADYPDGRHRHDVGRSIGGRDGRYDGSVFWAAVLLERGVYVQFDVHPPGESTSTEELDDVLDGVVWAPDPADEATWPIVAEWAR